MQEGWEQENLGGEHSGNASEKKGHGGASWIFVPPGGLE